MSSDGITEEANITTGLKGFAGGRVYVSPTQDVEIPVDGTGRVRPHIVASFAPPFVGGGSVGFADGENQKPYVMTGVVGCYAGDRKTCNSLYAAVRAYVQGLKPNGDNTTEISIPYAYDSNRRQTEENPAVIGRLFAFQLTINLSTA